MTAIHETAYPRLRSDWTDKQLEKLFTPTEEELKFARKHTRQPLAFASLLIQLKVFQCLGRFISFHQIPKPVITYMLQILNVQSKLMTTIMRQPKHLKSRYVKYIRTFMGVASFDSQSKDSWEAIVRKAAQTKHNLPDIINVILEELVRLKIELPSFSLMLRAAQKIRQQVHESYYAEIYKHMNVIARSKLKKLIKISDNKTSDWDRLKQDVKKPTPYHVKDCVKHLQDLQALQKLLPSIDALPPAKINHFFLEAQSMDSAMLKATRVDKRYMLMTIYIRQKSAQVLDDIAEIVIRFVKKLHNWGHDALSAFKLSQIGHVESLIMRLKQIVTVYTQEKTQRKKCHALDALLADKGEELIAECDAQLAYTNDDYFSFLLKPYKNRRTILFDCVELLTLKATSRDVHLERAISFMKQHRQTKKTHLTLPQENEEGYFSIDWIPKAWGKWVIAAQTNKGDTSIKVNKHYFELCVFSQLSAELKSGDLFVPDSDHFSDYRNGLISWHDYKTQVPAYVEMMQLERNPKAFTAALYEQLKNRAAQVDQKFPDNSFVTFKQGKLLLKKKKRQEASAEWKKLDQIFNERMPETNVLDVLVETVSWLNLSQDFGPVSGLSSRIDNPQVRFIMTLFCYGFNLGPTQTVRMVKGFSRRQIAWLNLRHITEEKLDKAITKVVNYYNKFALPKKWGSGKSASVDGAQWDVYEQNLLSERHIRYGGYGGIGYYHVSDTYIALFSHFIPCGTYEAIYILDGLLKNESDIQPNQIHGDTHAQSYTVFGLAFLLGIELMPRIRHIKDLKFYKSDKTTVYQHIESLFDQPIDWGLIERHLDDMLRVVLSIKSGKMTASSILRKLGNSSRKNKLYFAFRELGRVVRTEFLLRYIDDIDLRALIHAATCKSEEFHQFLRWAFFGGEGIIAENDRYEQQKIIKYNHLVANLVVLHNVRDMTHVLNTLSDERYEIDQDLIKDFAPYRTGHINRFGNHILDVDKTIPPLDEEKDFKLKMKVRLKPE